MMRVSIPRRFILSGTKRLGFSVLLVLMPAREPGTSIPRVTRMPSSRSSVCGTPRYGYRRITAQLRDQGWNINHKTVARIMRERGLQVRPLRRFVHTTQSDHDSPIFPNLTRGFIPSRADQLWVADITYIAIARGFVYLAVILDAWSRRVVG